mgnify:CR=1 FL=1
MAEALEFEVAALKIAITSRSFSKDPILRKELEDLYPRANIKFNEEGIKLEGQGLIEFLSDCDRAIIGLELLGESVLCALPKLKVISKYGVGLDMLDLEAMSVKGIKLGWKGGVNRRSVSELVISVAIALLRQIPEAHRESLAGAWHQRKGRELSGRTFGIIGCGRVGKDLVSLLKAFNCTILVNDIVDYPRFFADYDIVPVSLDVLLRESDAVSIHTPLNDTTRNILSADRLSMMKPDAILVNAARGGLVDEKALKLMLQDGRLAGAAFDVFWNEPPEDHELLNLPNFFVTPHLGGSSEEAILAMGRAAIAGLEVHGDPIEITSLPVPDGLEI